MPASPAMRCSPGRGSRGGNHKRGCSLESGVGLKEIDDDLALFNEVQSKEKDNFLLQANDDFEDTFVTKLRHFSDHKVGINITARGESSDLLNGVEEKNDYEWLITPPDTPLFRSLDDETPQVIPAQRGRPRAQPISFSRSSTMEKSHRSSRGSPSPNRFSPSRHAREPTFQPRNRATSAPSSSPPPTRRPATGSRRPSSPSGKPSSPPPRASTPTSRRLSTGSTSSTRGISVNSVSPKVRAWQANIPGFSNEAPPNLRTSLADRPASFTRGSSPASRNGRKSRSPSAASRNISSSHSKASSASADDDVESLPSVTVDGSEQSSSRRVSGFRSNNIYSNYKLPSPQKPSRTVSSSAAPKRSFDMALRQMDHRKSPQNMFRPLLSSVPTSNYYTGKSSPAWNSSVTSSNASSDLGASGPHDIEENERNDDDATSGVTKVPDADVDDEGIFMFEKTDSLDENIRSETYEISPNKDGFENLAQPDTAPSVVSDHFNSQDDILVCSKCGCEFSDIAKAEDEIKLCPNCQKSTPSLTVSDNVTSMSDKNHELVNNTFEPQLALVQDESPELTFKDDREHERTQLNHDIISQPSLSYSDTREVQIENTVDFPKSKVESLEREGNSLMLKRSSSPKFPVTRSATFSASSMSYDALSYISASSSVDFGPRLQSSRKSDTENYKYDPMNVKHRRSMSSLSGVSSHAFHPSSVGTSTLDSFDVSVVRVERDVADSASVGPQENPSENVTCTENVDSEEALLPEVLNVEEPALCEKVDDFGEETNALTTCTIEEGTSLTPVVDSAELAEVQLTALSEEVDHSCPSSPASQSHLSQHSENSIEELQDPNDSAAVGKDMEDSAMDLNTSHHSSSTEELQDPNVSATVEDTAVSAMECNTSNHSSSIIEESVVLVESHGGTKGRSLTLEEATDAILFCSSIVHNLAYEAATIAMEKEPSPEPSINNDYPPLVPAVPKSYSGRKDLQSRKTSKRSSKSQKMRRKTMEGDTIKAPNSINTGEETESQKTRIVHPNNKENTKPPTTLEAKCNCRIM